MFNLATWHEHDSLWISSRSIVLVSMVFGLFLPHMSSVLKKPAHRYHGWSWQPSTANEFPNSKRLVRQWPIAREERSTFWRWSFVATKNTGCRREVHNYTPAYVACQMWFLILQFWVGCPQYFWILQFFGIARSICPEPMQLGWPICPVLCWLKMTFQLLMSPCNTEDASSGQQWCSAHHGVPRCRGGGWRRATPMEVPRSWPRPLPVRSWRIATRSS